MFFFFFSVIFWGLAYYLGVAEHQFFAYVLTVLGVFCSIHMESFGMMGDRTPPRWVILTWLLGVAVVLVVWVPVGLSLL